jgi:hypothetical protein
MENVAICQEHASENKNNNNKVVLDLYIEEEEKNKTMGIAFIILHMGLHIPYGVVKVYDHMKDYAKSSLYDLQENLILKFHVDG